MNVDMKTNDNTSILMSVSQWRITLLQQCLDLCQFQLGVLRLGQVLTTALASNFYLCNERFV